MFRRRLLRTRYTCKFNRFFSSNSNNQSAEDLAAFHSSCGDFIGKFASGLPRPEWAKTAQTSTFSQTIFRIWKNHYCRIVCLILVEIKFLIFIFCNCSFSLCFKVYFQY